MINLNRLVPRCCLNHAKRLVDARMASVTECDGWRCIIAQCSLYLGSGLHCWLERGDKVYDLTRRKKPYCKVDYYEMVGVVHYECLDAEFLLAWVRAKAGENYDEVWDRWWTDISEDDEPDDNNPFFDLDEFIWRKNGWPSFVKKK